MIPVVWPETSVFCLTSKIHWASFLNNIIISSTLSLSEKQCLLKLHWP